MRLKMMTHYVLSWWVMKRYCRGNLKNIKPVVLIDLPFGHDAFLLDGDVQGKVAREFFAS